MPKLMRPTRARAGVTLIEVIIVLVLMGIVGSALSGLFVSQQRFYRDSDQVAGVRRELRNGAGILPLDLRAVSSVGGDILAFSQTMVEVNAPLGSGITCAAGGDSLVLLPDRLSRAKLSSFWAEPIAGDTIRVFDDGPSFGAEDDVWRAYVVAGVSSSASACASTPYGHPVNDAPALKPRRVIKIGGGATLPGTIGAGVAVRATRPMRYSLFQPTGSSAWYLGIRQYENGVWSDITAASGPYRSPADRGLRFTYFDTTGAPINSAARIRQIARIDVELRAESEFAGSSLRRSQPIRDSLLLRVGVRNYK